MSDTQSTWHDIHNLLESQRAQTIDAIRNYPPPIPACDAQFNYLLEKRDRLAVEINRLNQVDKTDDILQGLLDFLATSAYINDNARQAFSQRLERLHH